MHIKQADFIESYKEIAIKAARLGGEILKDKFNSNLKIKAKGKHDIVCNADFESEETIINFIKSEYPTHGFFAEESGKEYNNSDLIWFIDPLDGTANFIVGNPYFSVSIALVQRGKVILGVVFNPILNELYYAEKGKGAYLNGKKIHVSKKASLKDAFLGTVFLSENFRFSSKIIEKLVLNSRKISIGFSPAMNLCNVARGRLDGLIDFSTEPVDHAAGSLVVTEAGGTIQNFNNKNWDLEEVGIIASNGFIHNSILKTIYKT